MSKRRGKGGHKKVTAVTQNKQRSWPNDHPYEIRLRNLQAVIDKQFKGNATECATKIERAPAYLWQVLNRWRGIGETMARHIEQRLALAPLLLDQVTMNLDHHTRELRVTLTEGKTQMYFVVPMVQLNKLDAASFRHPKQVRPCISEEATEKTFAFVVVTDSMSDHIRREDIVFADRSKIELKHDGLYVVCPKKEPKTGLVRLAREEPRGFIFVATNKQQGDEDFGERDVQVYARVIHAERELV